MKKCTGWSGRQSAQAGASMSNVAGYDDQAEEKPAVWKEWKEGLERHDWHEF